MDSNNNYQMLKCAFLFFLFLQVYITEECQNFEEKSKELVPIEKYENDGWVGHWVTYYESPILYTYAICNNTTLEIGKQLELSGTESDIKFLKFENSAISTVPVGVFISFTRLTELYLNKSQIETIHHGAFSGLIKLEELYLQDNKIEVLERGTLNYLTKLRILDLSKNRLRIIEENSMLGLLNLQEIMLHDNKLNQSGFAPFNSTQLLRVVNLSNNSFNDLGSNAFGNLNQLQILRLNNNRLGNLTGELFENTTFFQILDVSSNNLTLIDFNVLPKRLLVLNLNHNKIRQVKNWIELRNVHEIDLGHNEISLIDEIGGGIKILNVSHNKIETLTEFSFRNSINLTVLDLGFNSLSVLSRPNLFENLTELRTLKLNNNRLSFMSVGSFKNQYSLKLLDLSDNSLIDLEFGTFSGLNNLETLSIARNKLAAIHENSFHVLENLKQLFINGNSISFLKIEQILEHTTRLEFLDLNGNAWNCNALFAMIKTLKEKYITVPHGDSYDTANIFGIPCKTENASSEIETSSKSLIQTEKEESATGNPTVANLSKNNLTESFFDQLFINYWNLSVFKFFNDTLRSAQLVKYFNNSGGLLSSFLKQPKTEYNALATEISKSSTFSSENTALIKALQDFSTRITGFIAIMTTIMLIIILLFLLLFIKPKSNTNYYGNGNETNVFQNGIELR